MHRIQGIFNPAEESRELPLQSSVCIAQSFHVLIQRGFIHIIITFAFVYSGSVEELTHSRELGGAVTQVFVKNHPLLKSPKWTELNK